MDTVISQGKRYVRQLSLTGFRPRRLKRDANCGGLFTGTLAVKKLLLKASVFSGSGHGEHVGYMQCSNFRLI